MYRTFVILRHTFREAIVQPIYTLLLVFGAAILIVFGMLPFFTLGEDTTMFKSVGIDVILLLVLIATLFATSKSIYDEIEDRTMLTLMSKPLFKWEVLVGKYLGIILAALLAIVVLGVILALATWYRIPNDYLIRQTLDDRELRRLFELRAEHVISLAPCLLQTWLQVSVLAAVGVAMVEVWRKPVVAILSTGDEIIAPGEPMRPGSVYVSNGQVLADAVRELGG
ncbi:MAG TPA: ABC transporter permease subunit, partial [Tepidisphaeraceae bacterium]